MADLWSDNTDIIVNELEPTVKTKYNVSLKRLLSNPGFMTSDKSPDVKIDNIKEEINNYLDKLVGEMSDESKRLEENAAKTDAVTKQLLQRITLESKQTNTPLIKPYALDRNEDQDQTIFINSANDSVFILLDKLTNSSVFVADMSYKYKNYSIGRWVFMGHEKYVVGVPLEPNPILDIENSRTELNRLLDQAKETIQR